MFRLSPRIVQENDDSDSDEEKEKIENEFIIMTEMEDLMDKLKILSYETQFVRKLKMMPISRHYFAIPKNPGEQFYLFTSLAAWLIRKLGKPFDQPQEDDDPNSTITTILNYIREMGVTVEFPPNKLKQGAGEQVIFILNTLADEAMKLTSFEWISVTSAREVEIEEDEIPELLEEYIEDLSDMTGLQFAFTSYDIYEDIWDDDVGTFIKYVPPKKQTKAQVEAWYEEVERLAPYLVVTIETVEDWRYHTDQVLKIGNELKQLLDKLRNSVLVMYKELKTFCIDVSVTEELINDDFVSKIDRFNGLIRQVMQLRETYSSISGGITERIRKRAKLMDEIHTIKRKLEEHGNNMTDGTPLVNLKKTYNMLKSDITTFDLQIGIYEHMFLQARLRDFNEVEENLGSAPNTDRSEYY